MEKKIKQRREKWNPHEGTEKAQGPDRDQKKTKKKIIKRKASYNLWKRKERKGRGTYCPIERKWDSPLHLNRNYRGVEEEHVVI